MTLSSLISDFLEYLELEQNASQLTIRNYDHYLKSFLEFSGDIDPKDIDLKKVTDYKLHLSKKPLKKITQNYFLIALRSLFRYLAGVGVAIIPAEEIELIKQEKRPLKILENADLKQLLEMPDISKKNGLRDKAILLTLLSTGLRVSELTLLNREDLDTENQISEDAKLWINRYLSARLDNFKPLFIRFQGKVDPSDSGEVMRLTPRSIERIVERYVKTAGIPVKATPQTIRYLHQQSI